MQFKTIVSTAVLASAGLVWSSCGPEKKTEGPKDTTSTGNIRISVDETFKPVMAQELNVFDSSYPEGHIKATYTNEQQCFQDLYKDSARLVITSRDLNTEEKAAFEKANIRYRALAVAKDAIAVIVHPNSVDSFMTLGQLKQVLLGKFAREYTIVFDNAQSSTVRYILDSLIPGQKLPSKTYAINNTDSLIAYVAKNEHAIGFIGVTHVYDPESHDDAGAFKKEIQVVALKNENDTTATDFYKPYQAYIGLKQYPLCRNIYFVTRDTWNGLGTGFANFLSNDAGQLIFAKARLFPLRVPVNLKQAEIK